MTGIDAIVRFKTAFRGTTAQQQTPLLAHRVAIPDSVGNDPAVLRVLSSLDDDLDQAAQDATTARAGKQALGRKWSSDKASSLKQVADAIGDQVDLDALEAVTKGKGQQPAQDALARVKDAEQQLQTAVADALFNQADDGTASLKDRVARVEDAAKFLKQPGVEVDSAEDRLVLSLAGVLAAKLGLPKSLKDATADEIKSAYLDKVYAPMTMAKKALKDGGEVGPIHEIILTLLTDVDRSKLTPNGAAEDLVTKLASMKLDQKATLNTARAGKYSSGVQEDREVALSFDGTGAKCKLQVQGNKLFADMVETSLTDIGGTEAGKKLLGALANAKDKKFQIVAPSVSSAQRLATDGTMLYSNSAGRGKVAFDPQNDLAGEDASPDKLAAEKWRQRDPSVALYHEMIHALIGNNGGEDWTTSGKTIRIGETGDVTELRIVGINYKTTIDGLEVTFPFADETYNPISENAYRKALAQKKGVPPQVRPYYANVAGQIPRTD